jgi:ABC-type transport system substrate-binding protein
VVVDEPATKLAALTAGELDFAGIQPAHAQFVARDPELAVLSYPLLMTYGIALNTRRAPFSTLAARQRLDATVDRRALVEGYLYGFGTPAVSPVPAELPGYVPVARDTMRPPAVGALRFELLTVGSGEAPLEQMVQAQLRAVGIQVTIRQLELSAFLSRVYGPSHDFQAAVLGVAGDPGLAYLGTIGRVAGLAVPADPAAAQRLMADSIAMVVLYHARGLQGMNRRVHGVRMDLRGELATVHDWWVDR